MRLGGAGSHFTESAPTKTLEASCDSRTGTLKIVRAYQHTHLLMYRRPLPNPASPHPARNENRRPLLPSKIV